MESIKSIIKGLTIGIVSLFFFSSCDLDEAPIDFYGSESYWKTETHFTNYMIGLRSDLRKRSFFHIFDLGEARGGSIKTGTSIGGESLSYGVLANQSLHTGQTGITGWGDIYGRITNVNLFIQRTEETNVLTDDKKKKLLAQAYGIRAFWYFDLYRAYGSCPLQLTAKVVNGIVVPEELYEGRADASKVMQQIKGDLKKSLDNFGDDVSFDRQKSTWSKAATEALAADVYLWTAKVSTLDDTANPADIDIAKTHLLSLTKNYGLDLLPTFTDIYNADPTKKGHTEAIMAIRYSEGEAGNSMGSFVYNWTTSQFNDAWLYEDGRVTSNDTLQVLSSGQLRVEYKKQMFLNYDKEDARRDATFLSVYKKDTKELAGLILRKNLGIYNKDKNQRIYCGDELWYRLAWVYLALAEVENFQGGDPAKYINIVRKRAYGDKWNESKYGYVNADFTTNELAILKEKDKEFVCEGQRWWDVRRMTLTKGGKHLVFVPEGNVESSEPILNETTEAHKVLYPIETNMLNKDPLLTQTPGY
ncbi:RagB/SusD family nutrient uptake outer membrane protein [Dysgonomonas sp. Shenzhen-Wh21]|uniref:RagB/SusD family nutrient uptake outer membrane protein n=1 Tax=Dysgonomonas TaxID=156973 RepID=UPI00208EAFE4|nr:RagB/SusD family nutrient uptake outer membrane protein [Dysgonomonas mossii]